MYQALYRKYRSQTFSQLVGQEVVAKTLKQAVEQEKISHAYLFSGPRGTGKTSVAKIFAKAMNCPNQVDGEPCNNCYICQAVTEGSLEDVIEMDAASNNGVDEIREIRDKSTYAPSLARYKVYIIDEVHMLSTGAFNALLKTLEEPTQNVVFILATTELHKIPATILSRVQRFEFKSIRTQDITAHIHHILEKENISFPNLAVFLSYNKELFIKQSQVMRHGNLIKIPTDEYLALLKKGYIYGFFDNYQTFELWLSGNIENYPENEEIFPLPEKYS